MIGSLLIATLPAVLISVLIYLSDNKYDREPVVLLLVSFFVGGVAFFLVRQQERFLISVISDVPFLLKKIFKGFFVCGLLEELWKLIIVLIVVWRRKSFNEYYDGIVYAVFVSMGFACVENVSYLIHAAVPTSSLLYRAVLTVPAHFLFAVLMGYYLSIAKFENEKRLKRFSQALFYPVLFHGTFNTLLFLIPQGRTGALVALGWVIVVVFIGFDFLLWRWAIQRINRIKRM